jgi:hypothetical protein
LLILPELVEGLRRRSRPLLAAMGAAGAVVAIALAARLLDFQALVR